MFVVIATDNMDCAVNAFNDLRKRRWRGSAERDSLTTWAALCDDIVCSSDTGKLKSEIPDAFFGTVAFISRAEFRTSAFDRRPTR